LGDLREPNVQFTENGLRFRANLIDGQKSGFFFDQRDNRNRIRALSSGRRMLNLFGYTGGFSVYAGAGGAEHVTTVDLAKPAIEDAEANWALNGLQPQKHVGVAADVFKFLEQANAAKDHWDLIVVDPPSFAKSSKHIDAAQESYSSLFTSALRVLDSGGIIALSSCSSHISTELFLEICGTSLSKARRRGTILGIYGQPEDHPFPFVCKELQYLKFVLLKVS
jgi:23S rRNA (cytosine1962-C5)-methyltransferase